MGCCRFRGPRPKLLELSQSLYFSPRGVAIELLRGPNCRGQRRLAAHNPCNTFPHAVKFPICGDDFVLLLK